MRNSNAFCTEWKLTLIIEMKEWLLQLMCQTDDRVKLQTINLSDISLSDYISVLALQVYSSSLTYTEAKSVLNY